MRLTPRQVEVARTIGEFWARFERGPSYREIGEILGLSKVTVQEHIKNLEGAGVAASVEGKMRTIHLTEAGKTQLGACEPQLRWPVRGTLGAKGVVFDA